MSKSLAIVLLSFASLATFAAAPPRDPCVLVWDIETPLLWTACLSVQGQQVIVTSTTTPQETDPLWWDVQQWAVQNEIPETSPLVGCFLECKALCLPGTVRRAKFTAGDADGDPPSSCECECYPAAPTTNPPPPNGSAD